jgi:hypothetical protein
MPSRDVGSTDISGRLKWTLIDKSRGLAIRAGILGLAVVIQLVGAALDRDTPAAISFVILLVLLATLVCRFEAEN